MTTQIRTLVFHLPAADGKSIGGGWRRARAQSGYMLVGGATRVFGVRVVNRGDGR